MVESQQIVQVAVAAGELTRPPLRVDAQPSLTQMIRKRLPRLVDAVAIAAQNPIGYRWDRFMPVWLFEGERAHRD